jgi:hypothetical protein
MYSQRRGYRALPKVVDPPTDDAILSEEVFRSYQKERMETGSSIAQGHDGTDVWYSRQPHSLYLVEIRLTNAPSVYAKSPCTYRPYQGMDRIDGCFAEDVEAFVLEKVLGHRSARLEIFRGGVSVDILSYLKDRRVFLGAGVQIVERPGV